MHLRTLDVSHRFDDQSVMHAHQIDPALRIRIAAPKTPANYCPISQRGAFFEIEMSAGCCSDRRPEGNTSVASNALAPVDFLDHTILGDHSRQGIWFVSLKNFIEAIYESGRGRAGFLIVWHCFKLLYL